MFTVTIQNLHSDPVVGHDCSVHLKQNVVLIHCAAVQSVTFYCHPIVVCKFVLDDLNATRFFCFVRRNSLQKNFRAHCSLAIRTAAPLRSTLKFRGCTESCIFLLSGAHGVREEPRFVTARAGESVILGCDVSPPLDGQQPPYVVEWFKFGVPIPFFINFRFYPPHVDPEYTGEINVAK